VPKYLYQQEPKKGGKVLLLALRLEVGLKAATIKSATTTELAVTTTPEMVLLARLIKEIYSQS
jgi:hypothetical protein